MTATTRPPIPEPSRVRDPATRASVRLSPCGYCRRPGVLIPTQTAHIQGRGAGGGDERSNLVALCPKCHASQHAGGRPTPDDLREIVARRAILGG